MKNKSLSFLQLFLDFISPKKVAMHTVSAGFVQEARRLVVDPGPGWERLDARPRDEACPARVGWGWGRWNEGRSLSFTTSSFSFIAITSLQLQGHLHSPVHTEPLELLHCRSIILFSKHLVCVHSSFSVDLASLVSYCSSRIVTVLHSKPSNPPARFQPPRAPRIVTTTFPETGSMKLMKPKGAPFLPSQ